ncbi:hypothetical protein VCHA51O444_10015 [Vibrio chagasii]|nr:hypothetical protein VCHA51O444_10015 [Vibrio chagasii]CAH7218052.1 hypothetical protein VCHA53O474_240014 [Vibrio chagasii]
MAAGIFTCIKCLQSTLRGNIMISSKLQALIYEIEQVLLTKPAWQCRLKPFFSRC